MKKLNYSLPEIDGLLSFPTEEVMKYGIEHDLLDSPGLLMHIMLCRTLVFQLAKALPKNIHFDIDTALSLTTVYHATRQAADNGKAGKHQDPMVNELMKTRGDMDYALNQAIEHGFSLPIIQGVGNYRINPSTRESGYFPHESLEKNGNINWTETIPMLTSWLVAGAITHTDKRFHDLRTRRSAEIGKLELPYWQAKIIDGQQISLPRPLVETALKDKAIILKNEEEIIAGIKNGIITNEVMGKWILDGYEEWTNKVISEYCRISQVSDFYKFLESGVDRIGDFRPEKKQKIKTSFEKFLGRPLTGDEFIPYIDGIDLLFKRIEGLKVGKAREIYRKKLTRTMGSIERTVGLLSKDESTYGNQSPSSVKIDETPLLEIVKY